MSLIHHQIYSDNPHKPWILMIHGLFGSLDNLSALRRELSDSFQILSVDLPDHGKSTFTQGFDFTLYAEQLWALTKQLSIPRLSLLGHSLGGKVAMQIALTQQQHIEHLVVLDIAPIAYEPRHSNVFKGLGNVDLSTLTSRKQADEMLREYIKENSTRQFLLKSLYQQDDKWAWRFNLHVLERDYFLLSSAITSSSPFTGKVLLVKGELSDYLLAQHRNAILQLFPNAKSKMVGATGHWLHAEKPQICGEIIRNFLSYT
jgi:esterase